MAITFQLSRVARATAPLAIPTGNAALSLQGRPVEAMGASAPFQPAETHGFVHAVHLAYAQHHPLALSPDAIWLCIAQGFAMHVNAEAERLRGKFVRHEGQATLEVRRDDFVKGSPENPWPEVFGAFSDAIAAHIGRQRDLVVCDFSTTGPCERAASEITLLDAMQRYFRYELHTMCGIPEITLEGTVDDWRSIRRRARALEEYELSWWTDALGPVLDQLVATAEGRVDRRFWETFFKHVDGSGGPYVRGWINVLLPYLRRGEREKLSRNRWMAAWQEGLDESFDGGAAASSIPSGLSSVPFTWVYLGAPSPMLFLGGFVGVAQDAGTLALRPAIGWAVRADVMPAADLVPDEAALLAGRVTSARELTLEEIAAVAARIERLGEDAGVPLACVPAGDYRVAAEIVGKPVRCCFGVGLRVVASEPGRLDFDVTDLRRALEAARALPEALWREVGAILPGGITEDPALHLLAAGVGVHAWLSWGVESERQRSVLAMVGTGRGVWAIIDISPQAHDARVASMGARGVEAGAVRYWLEDI